MDCPFKVGDRIRSKEPFEPPAVVTEITERGFKYQYDYTWHISPRLGIAFDEGECYLDVYPELPKWILESEWTPEFSKIKSYAFDKNSNNYVKIDEC